MANNVTGKDLADCFISPNVSDSNAEAANLVDVVNYVAHALRKLASTDIPHDAGPVQQIAFAIERAGDKLADAINKLATAISDAAP
jgi:hypothetical protein